MKILIFPGQGCQFVGMGKELYRNESKEVFDRVDDALNYKLSDIIFNGPSEKLNNTQHTQVALMTVSVALSKAMEKLLSIKLTNICSYMAGHSLGQYTALTLSGSIALEDTAKILSLRGKFMNECENGIMAACLGVKEQELQKFLNNYKGKCEIANYNSSQQIVIGGEADSMEDLIISMKNAGKKIIKLNVSGAFHTKLMTPAAEKLRNALEEISIKKSEIPIINNVNALPITNAEEIKESLAQQVTSSVKWYQTMKFIKNLTKNNIDIIEIGPKPVLTTMLKKDRSDDSNIGCINICHLSDIEKIQK